MVKFISQIIGARVLLYQERAIVGEVSRVLIDPDDGTFVGLTVQPVHQKELAYIPTNEIKGFGEGFVLVEGLDSLSEKEDVIKIQKVLETEPLIIRSRVITESGQRIGTVEDATIDLRYSVLKKIYVNPNLLLGIIGTQKIIDRKQIIKIIKKTIVVKDAKTTSRAEIPIGTEIPVTE